MWVSLSGQQGEALGENPMPADRRWTEPSQGSARAEWGELEFAGQGPDMESKPRCFNRHAQKEVSKAAEEAFVVKIFLLAS